MLVIACRMHDVNWWDLVCDFVCLFVCFCWVFFVYVSNTISLEFVNVCATVVQNWDLGLNVSHGVTKKWQPMRMFFHHDIMHLDQTHVMMLNGRFLLSDLGEP